MELEKIDLDALERKITETKTEAGNKDGPSDADYENMSNNLIRAMKLAYEADIASNRAKKPAFRKMILFD